MQHGEVSSDRFRLWPEVQMLLSRNDLEMLRTSLALNDISPQAIFSAEHGHESRCCEYVVFKERKYVKQ